MTDGTNSLGSTTAWKVRLVRKKIASQKNCVLRAAHNPRFTHIIPTKHYQLLIDAQVAQVLMEEDATLVYDAAHAPVGNSVHEDAAPVDDCVQKDAVLEDDGVHEDAAPKDDGVSKDAALKDAVVRTMMPRPWLMAYATEYDGLDDTGRPVFDRPMLCLSFGR